MTKINHFKYFKTSPEIIKLAVMYYVRYPLSLRNVEDILHERGIDICHETVRYWWNRFGILFSKEVKRKTKHYASNWRWHIDGSCQIKMMYHGFCHDILNNDKNKSLQILQNQP